ncbi:MAG TPA: hypothetical protein DCP03_13610 [Polaromonas sp.]|nr:hypothetical protein [Polaromonas sp.]
MDPFAILILSRIAARARKQWLAISATQGAVLTAMALRPIGTGVTSIIDLIGVKSKGCISG